MTTDFPAADQQALLQLLDRCQSLNLATCDAVGHPHSSYAPFIVFESQFCVFLSELSDHCRNLMRCPKAGGLVIEDEAHSAQVFARRRLSLSLNAKRIERQDPTFARHIASMRDRHGPIIDTLQTLADFHLFALEPSAAQLVLGFGRAIQIPVALLLELLGKPLDQPNKAPT